MTCTFCKQPCQTGYRVLDVAKNKAVAEYYLCYFCGTAYVESMFAKSHPKLPTAKHVSATTINSAAELLALLIDKANQTNQPVQRATHPPCPKCGHTIADLQAKGRFGCAHCYKHFDNMIVNIVDIAQNGAKKHIGKIPKNIQPVKPNPESGQSLKEKLAYAIEHEYFEEAAKLRDLLKDLES